MAKPDPSLEKAFRCDHHGCKYGSDWEKNLIRHISARHREDLELSCPSNGCPYRTRYKSTLNRHVLACMRGARSVIGGPALSGLPRRLQMWRWFRSAVLDKHFEALFPDRMDKAKFRQLVAQPKERPYYFRGLAKETKGNELRKLQRACRQWYKELLTLRGLKLVRGKFGFGLAATKNWNLKAGQELPVPAEFVALRAYQRQLLKAAGFDLMFRDGALIGPIALFNHRCTSSLCFRGRTLAAVKAMKSQRPRNGKEVYINYETVFFSCGCGCRGDRAVLENHLRKLG